MALQVSADAVRRLIPDGAYILQLLERRDGQSLVLTLTLASRKMAHTLHIETAEANVAEFLRCLLATTSSPSKTERRSRPSRQPRSTEVAAGQEPARAATTASAAREAVAASSVHPRRRSRRSTSRL